MESSCKIEKEDKARCCYQFCGKLFKDAAFLRKHLQSKHPSFATDVFLVEAEPFMRKRYEAEDISYRPLPPVEIEVGDDEEEDENPFLLDFPISS